MIYLDYNATTPIDPEVVVSGDSGLPVVQSEPDSETAKAFSRVADALLEREANAE